MGLSVLHSPSNPAPPEGAVSRTPARGTPCRIPGTGRSRTRTRSWRCSSSADRPRAWYLRGTTETEREAPVTIELQNARSVDDLAALLAILQAAALRGRLVQAIAGTIVAELREYCRRPVQHRRGRRSLQRGIVLLIDENRNEPSKVRHRARQTARALRGQPV